MELVIATKNLHKLREYRLLLKKIKGLDILSLKDFPDYVPVEETGKTFEENAELKAKDAAKKLGKFVLADDSGLVVPALDGEPGIFSARYAGKDATDLENRKELIKKIEKLPQAQRNSYYECVICIADPEGAIKKNVKGFCEGEVITQERGNNGFGYDSIFVKYDYSKTFGELDEMMKNEISHRRKALDKAISYLEEIAKRVAV
ncbi:MAG: Non-canonical purine NTP pyrophosphatase [Chlamydiae bacterium]|nr:Non-canonical purine NTP pyrophosphatase [Chlamydiota bacterium]